MQEDQKYLGTKDKKDKYNAYMLDNLNSKRCNDSSCLNYITNYKNILPYFTSKKGQSSYDDNKGKSIGLGTIGKSHNPTF